MKYEENLLTIATLGKQRENENQDFRTYLKVHFESAELDAIVHPINERVSAAIDCTKCGNCCKSLMINITNSDADRAASHLNLPIADFHNKYIEKGAEAETNIEVEGTMLINTIPCHFLADNKCTIYEARFTECREFPHIHKPQFQQRLLGMIMHYDRCPIVYNVLEELKQKVHFSYKN
jgi:hypothetical protein